TALSQFNRTLTDCRGTIHFTSTDPQAILPSDYTFTAADAGSHTFSVTLKTAGSQSIQVMDVVHPVAYSRFEEGSGTSVIDSVDGSTDGTHTASYSSDVPVASVPGTGATDQFSLKLSSSMAARITDQNFILHSFYGDATLEFWVKNTVPSGESDLFWTRED